MQKEIRLVATKADFEQIRIVRSVALAQIEGIKADPKPTYKLDDQMIGWNRYKDILEQTIAWCDQQLAIAGTIFDG